MARSKLVPSSSLELMIYIGYLASFMVLLAGSAWLFGTNPMSLVFQLFIVLTLGIVALASRIMG
ncbi:MAG TPA: hypothetical protein VJ224_02260 [Thermoplasmata archaeon]|nr:hypothetical protein [Thermoplasmata archaeon]